MMNEAIISEPSSRLVYIVDDDLDVRIALEALLQSVGLQVMTFSSAEEFLAQALPSTRACLVLDVRLTGQSGIGLQNHLSRIDSKLPIIFISGHGDIPMAVRAIKAGAAEFLTKPLRPQELIDAIHAAFAKYDERLLADQALASAKGLFDCLTQREKDVMSLVVAGYGNKETANILGISEPTVKAHRGQVMKKMAAESLPDLVRLAQELEMPSPNNP
jgi:FixJ family two-component response regulator